MKNSDDAQDFTLKTSVAYLLMVRINEYFLTKPHSSQMLTLFHRLENLEAGARDATDFNEWQSRMRKQDLDQQLADIERRRLEGKLSHEEAILARQGLIQENKQKVQEMKEEVGTPFFFCLFFTYFKGKE